MSTLFVQSSLRNTKSFASKYNSLWRRGGAISCIRNLILWNKRLSCRLLLEVGSLGPYKSICIHCHWFTSKEPSLYPLSLPSSSTPSPFSLPLPHTLQHLYTSLHFIHGKSNVWVLIATCPLPYPRAIYLHPQPLQTSMGQSRAAPVRMSYLKPSALILGTGQMLQFQTHS